MRLPLLLGLLAAVATYGMPRILHRPPASASGGCPIGPPAAKLATSSFRELIAHSGIESLIGAGTPDVQGWQGPAAAWTDFPPPPLSSPAPAWVDAGYQRLWWAASEDHQGAGVFVFDSPAAAAQYVREAASTRCRHTAVAYPVDQPTGARALVWVNPLGIRQADLFFARGARAFRITEVPPDAYAEGPAQLDAGDLVEMVRALACQLRDAGCRPPREAPTLSWGGWYALRRFIIAAGWLSRDRQPGALVRFANNCLAPVGSADDEARDIETGCKAAYHLVQESLDADNCRRSRAIGCERANLAAEAADLERVSAAGRALASELSAGLCRDRVAGAAVLDARQAEGLQLYVDGLPGNQALPGQARRRLSATAAGEQSLESYRQLADCAPTPTEARRADSL